MFGMFLCCVTFLNFFHERGDVVMMDLSISKLQATLGFSPYLKSGYGFLPVISACSLYRSSLQLASVTIRSLSMPCSLVDRLAWLAHDIAHLIGHLHNCFWVTIAVCLFALLNHVLVATVREASDSGGRHRRSLLIFFQAVQTWK